MTITARIPRSSRAMAGVLAALACGAALAQEIQDTRTYSAPENSVSVGAGASSGDHRDRTRFGIFNGLRENDTNLLLDFNYGSRNSNSGRWMTFQGRNIGLDNRELGFDYRHLGDLGSRSTTARSPATTRASSTPACRARERPRRSCRCSRPPAPART
jgi:hypothetical protein